MRSFRIEITEKILIRINRFLPKPIKKERVPPCFGEPNLYSGYCNGDEPLPDPTEEIPKPVHCACRRPCLIMLAEQLGMADVEAMVSMDDNEDEPKKLIELCKSEFAALVAAEPVQAAPPAATLSNVPEKAQNAITDEDRAKMRADDDGMIESATVSAPSEAPKQPPQASPAPPEVSSEPVQTTDPGAPAPTEGSVPQDPPVEHPAAIDNSPTSDPDKVYVKKPIPFRRSSAAWTVWGILTELLTPEELDAQMRARNYKYLKKQLPAVLAKAKEMGVLTEYDNGILHIMGSWDMEPGIKAKKTAAKKEEEKKA